MLPRLANDHITFSHGGNTVRLVPSLRAAISLQRKFGLAKCNTGVLNASLEVSEEIISAGTDCDPEALATFRNLLSDCGFKTALELRPQLLEFIAQSFGLDIEQEYAPTSKSNLQRKPLEETLADFFEIGTGWLGWTPKETLAATPLEITASYSGQIAKLKAIHGSSNGKDENVAYSSEDLAEIEKQGFDPGFDREALHSLKFSLKSQGVAV